MKVRIIQGLRRLRRSGEHRPDRDAPEAGWERRRLERLEARTEHLELMLEGLQDAVHRRAVLEDETLGELRRRTEAEIERDLGQNTRGPRLP